VAIEKRLIEFTDDELGDVADAVAALRDGEWCNIEPYLDQDDLDELRNRIPHPLVRMFQKAGAPIPLGTIARTGGVLSVGLEHPHAAKAIVFLRDNGVATPREWKIKQDHPRRGIVLEVAAATPPTELLTWLTRAGRMLSSARIGREWTALVSTKT
jgi:hypothetical protein